MCVVVVAVLFVTDVGRSARWLVSCCSGSFGWLFGWFLRVSKDIACLVVTDVGSLVGWLAGFRNLIAVWRVDWFVGLLLMLVSLKVGFWNVPFNGSSKGEDSLFPDDG